MTEPDQNPAQEPPRGTFEELGRQIDALPHVRSAERLIRQAQAELDRARAQFVQMEAGESASKLRALRDNPVTNTVGDALDYVRRHPGQGIIGSILVGLLFGRIFRR